MRKETGIGRRLLEELARQHKGDPQRQLMEFFGDFHITALTGRKRYVSHKTEERYFDALKTVLRVMPKLNMRIGNLTELSPKHARAVILELERQGHSASQLATVTTALRRLGTWMGKPDLAPVVSEIVEDAGRTVRNTTSVVAKTWESQGVDPEAVFTAMESECPITSMQLRLGWAFGLRAEEQVSLRPHLADKGDRLVITHGTKGGRVREVQILHGWEREILDKAKAMAASHPEGILTVTVPGRNGKKLQLHRVLVRYYNLCDKIGLTKKGRFGTTPHGSRHSFACRRYQWRTGLPAPVLGGATPATDVDFEARKEGSLELGHGRVSATGAYLGTVPTMKRLERIAHTRLQDLDAKLSADFQLLRLAEQAQLTTYCLVGPVATGARVPPLVAVFCESMHPIPPALSEQILIRTGEVLNTHCVAVHRDTPSTRDMPTFEVVALGRFGRAGRAPTYR